MRLFCLLLCFLLAELGWWEMGGGRGRMVEGKERVSGCVQHRCIALRCVAVSEIIALDEVIWHFYTTSARGKARKA